MSFGLLSAFSGNIPISGNLSINYVTGGVPGQYISAAGGVVTTFGDYKIHSFYSTGQFVISSLGSDVTYGSTVEYMVIGGGGGGGRDMGGGGGAGGYRAATNFSVSATTYLVTVGAGGAGAFNSPSGTVGGAGNLLPGSNGSSSVFSTITSAGGGGGASRHDVTSTYAGSGGSGGGSSGDRNNRGLGNIPASSPSQGNPGSLSSGQWYPGGGGGAGQAGSHGAQTAVAAGPGNTNQAAPNGGYGVENSILGYSYWWAGGGGGGGYSTYGGNGGTGGGGGGSPSYVENNYGKGGQSALNPGQPGEAGFPFGTGTSSTPSAYAKGGAGGQFTGGGGGASQHVHSTTGGDGGPGGSGIVVIRYKYK